VKLWENAWKSKTGSRKGTKPAKPAKQKTTSSLRALVLLRLGVNRLILSQLLWRGHPFAKFTLSEASRLRAGFARVRELDAPITADGTPALLLLSPAALTFESRTLTLPSSRFEGIRL
jgi:hypothetical protein